MANKNHVSGFPIWRKNNPKAFALHQKKAFKKLLEKNPNHQSKAGKKGGKRKEELHPLTKEQASSMGKKSYKNNPNHVRDIAKKLHRDNPRLASELGKRCQKKHPEIKEKLVRWLRKNPEHLSQIPYSGTKPELMIRELLPNDFVFNKWFGNGFPDFRSDKRKIIIEFNGIAHYKPIYGLSQFQKRIIKDKEKKDYALSKGYKYYELTYKDFENKREFKNKVLEIIKYESHQKTI